MAVARLALRSLWNRRVTASLTVFAIAVSVTLLLGVQKVRTAAREGFASTISATDLVVGARSSPINLLLYSVFRIGDATANVSWQSYQKIAAHPDVAWSVPLSLGDSHRGFRVMGTSREYFMHYRYAGKRPLEFSAGKPFDGPAAAVLGADVAEALRYRLADPIVVAHGLGDVSFHEHDAHPFSVVGILERTGTPVDRTVHVSLEAISAIHADWESGAHVAREDHATDDEHDEHDEQDLAPKSITAFLVGMRSTDDVLRMQRAINEYRDEPLSAIIPAVALQQLWSIVGLADRALLIIAAFVVLAGLLGMLTAILTSLNERRREMAILRSVGAHPRDVFTLLVAEAGILAASGVVLGVAATYGLLLIAQPLLARRFGIFVEITGLAGYDLALLGGIVATGLLIGLIPAWRAYRNSLADGLTMRV